MVFHQYLRIGEFVWDLVVCGTRYYQSASVDCSGVIQKINMRELEVRQGIVSMMNMIDFMIRGCSARPNAALMAQGSALTRNVILYMARRTCFKEQYYTDTRRYICVREDCGQYQAETMYIFVMVFHEYLRIGQFVWDLVLLGTRYYQSASVDCSGMT